MPSAAAYTGRSGRHAPKLHAIPDCVLVLALLAAPAQASSGKDPATDWSAYLGEFLPAIEACLAAADGPAVVTKAWPMNRGLVGVRLLDLQGHRFDCLMPEQGGVPVAYDPLSEDGERLPGEFQPLFTPAPDPRPAGACYEHEQVLDPTTGEALGWLSYDRC